VIKRQKSQSIYWLPNLTSILVPASLPAGSSLITYFPFSIYPKAIYQWFHFPVHSPSIPPSLHLHLSKNQPSSQPNLLLPQSHKPQNHHQWSTTSRCSFLSAVTSLNCYNYILYKFQIVTSMIIIICSCVTCPYPTCANLRVLQPSCLSDCKFSPKPSTSE